MKLIIQIPCFNEEATLPQVLAGLPRQLDGIDRVEWLVVDDGSRDRTSDVAREGGVDHIVRHPVNLGLGRAFLTGIQECVRLGADIIVNTDGDNQYAAGDIPALIRPILEGKAEIVVGARPIDAIAHFSPVKKCLQKLGSRVIRAASGTDVPDAPSGFRAFARHAAMQLNVFSDHTYTLETIIQAGQKGIPVTSVPVHVNAPTRPSRLSRNTYEYVRRSLATIIRIFMLYRPMRFFIMLGAVPFGAGMLVGLRFLIAYFMGHGDGKIQSLILAAVLLICGFFLFIIALLADLISANRRLLEKLDWRLREVEEKSRAPAAQGPHDTRA